ncbi:hypothetical protein B9Z55_003483 [Caenorhabditis nigoni]|uniref:F-box domain-containing protein n=3 Tax=Caenorhabditis nigoni TaxID=1611254 RepID=A0A2G5VQN9_9PELO|nr:hypothetical protein B9Z55_003483 [Caenorhabditis nigoni]
MRLPRIVQKEIMENLDPFEIFDLSECSKRARSVARLKNMKEFRLEIHENSIDICGTNLETFAFAFDEAMPPNLDEVMPPLLEKILDVFGYSQVRDFSSGDKSFKLFASISEILIQRKCKIGTLYFTVENVEEKQLKHILDNLNISDFFFLDTNFQFSPNFDYKPIRFPELLCIANSWFGLDQLLTAVKGCLEVEITNSSFTIRDLNEFLGKWMAEEIQNMTAFSISISSDDFLGDSPVLGMTPPIMGRLAWQRRGGIVGACIRYGHLIKSINGQEAVIQLIRDRFSVLFG